MNVQTNTDHALLAAAYLSSASELARQGYEWDKDSGAYARTLALIALAEGVLAVAHKLRDGITVGA
jgi:hypothetical protein